MDYQALSMLVSKPVVQWSITQISKWLHFIHMQNFIPNFEKSSFNGQTIMKINLKTLSIMGINSNIMQKKLMIWIEKGFLQFNQYIDSNFYNKENISPNTINMKLASKTYFNKIQQDEKIHKRPEKIEKIEKMEIQEQNHQQSELSNLKLKITNFQGPQTVYYIADYKGIRIGRSIQNQIKSLQVTVQNHHAHIFLDRGHFSIKDLGTSSGTFIKVHYKIQLVPQMLIQMGTYLLKVQKILGPKQILLKCINLNHKDQVQELQINFQLKSSFSFGRRGSNDFARDDQHLSGTHAKIYFFNGKFILQDMGSTNGTWLRLSSFRRQSKPHRLQDGQIIKIGNTISYICQYQKQDKKVYDKMQIQSNSHICIKCNQYQRNILYLPCKHSINCQMCCQEQHTCYLCQHTIQQKVKMFI